MRRRVLLIEPNYKNKYPPMGLMKLSTYHKKIGDEVAFFKGDLKEFIIEEIYFELLDKLKQNDNSVLWEAHKQNIVTYLKKGSAEIYEQLCELTEDKIAHSVIKYYRSYYYKKEYIKNPKWDRVCITTLFTFYWDITIQTIEYAKILCKSLNEIWVGGVTASVLSKEIELETGIKPWEGLLDRAGIMDDNNIVIDHQPLDYSIIEETDYEYPENDAYYSYMTRGCVNKCPFCAVPKIEPRFNDYISIEEHIRIARDTFGERCNLLLLDNNILASDDLEKIVDEIKRCGFDKKTKFVRESPFEIAIRNLKTGYNDRAYIKSIIKQLKILVKRSTKENANMLFSLLDSKHLLSEDTATKENILAIYDELKDHFKRIYKFVPRDRHVDFNQGIDARLLDEPKMKKLAELPIRPLRIAFDDWKYKDTYENAVRLAVSFGIKELSNYVLYNYKDKPIELYYRLKMNVNMCDGLNVSIYSFPMKYHPIQDKEYFKNRDYIGVHWNKKFIRAIQAVLNSTKGKVGKGLEFFEEAFGSNDKEFEKILYMPEVMIIYRFYYKGNGLTEKWWNEFCSLNEEQSKIAKRIIGINKFDDISSQTEDEKILSVLKYYTVSREDAESLIKKQGK